MFAGSKPLGGFIATIIQKIFMCLLNILAGWVLIFGKPANNYDLGKQSPLTIICLHLLHSLPMLFPPLYPCFNSGLSVTASLSLLSCLVEIKSPFQCVSPTDIFNRNLFESPTNNMYSKVISKLLTKSYFKVKSRW